MDGTERSERIEEGGRREEFGLEGGGRREEDKGRSKSLFEWGSERWSRIGERSGRKKERRGSESDRRAFIGFEKSLIDSSCPKI